MVYGAGLAAAGWRCVLEIPWLLDFVALSRTGIFARAAEMRNVTQPAFTRRIKRLEYAVGAELVDRSVHPVVLTAAGERFLPAAQNIIYEWEYTRAELSNDGTKTETIRIATLQSLAVSYLPKLVRTLYPSGRSPKFKIIADNFAGCIESVISGNADAMICYSHKDIQTGEHVLDDVSLQLGWDKLIPVSCAKDGAALYALEDATLPFLSYSKMSFLGRVTMLMLEQATTSLSLAPIYEDSIAAALKSATMEGLGIAWLPEALVRPEIEAGSLMNIASEHPEFEVQIGVSIYRGHRSSSRTVDRFWNTINAQCLRDDMLGFRNLSMSRPQE